MEKQKLNLTTPKLLEYAAKAVMLVNVDYLQRGHMKLEGNTLTVVFASSRSVTARIRVTFGDLPEYGRFVEKLLTKLNKVTGKTYTEKDLNIY